MPFISGLSGALHVGAKTWRPKSVEQQQAEAQQKRLALEESKRKIEVQQKIDALEQVRKLEAKTQALNEMATAAEIRSQEYEAVIRERQAAENRAIELAKLELAKRRGQEALTEADLARLRRERMRTELLARAATNHAIHETERPVSSVNIGPAMVPPPPPPPIPHSLPPPLPHPHPLPPGPLLPHPPLSHHIPLSMPSPYIDPPLHMRPPTDPLPRARRMSDTMPPVGIARGTWGLPSNALRGVPPPPPPVERYIHEPHHHHHRHRSLRELNEKTAAELALIAQAERLRRKKLETLDLKARHLQLKTQALRDLRQRELLAQLKERGLQQREIDTQLRMLAERDRNLTEAELRELRDREHRLMLKEKGLQEREILEQVRRREERDREMLRITMDQLEREFRRRDLLEAELSIKRAMERGEAPPLGIHRPTLEDIERDGLLNDDDFWDEVEWVNPRLRNEIWSDGSFSTAASINTRMSDFDHTPARTPLSGVRTPLMRSHSPNPTSAVNQIRDEQMRVHAENQRREDMLNAARTSTPRMREEIMRQMTPLQREEFLMEQSMSTNPPWIRGQEMLGDNLSQTSGRPRSHSFGRTSNPSDELKAREVQRMRDDLRLREEINRMNPDSSHRPNMSQLYPGGDLPARSVSRASSRAVDYDHLARPLSRNGSMRDAQSPAGERLALPSRPSSRNLTAEDLGLNFMSRAPSRERERVVSGGGQNSASLLEARLHSAALNSEINGGRRSRANSRVEPVAEDLLRSARAQLGSELNVNSSAIGRRSRANSKAEPPREELLRSARSLLNSDFGSTTTATTIGGRSRTNSRAEPPQVDLLRSNSSRSQLESGLAPASALAGARSRASSRASELPSAELRTPSRNQLSAELALSTTGRRSRASSVNQPPGLGAGSGLRMSGDHPTSHTTTRRSPRVDHPDPSRSASRFSNHAHGHMNLTNEELAQMTTEQLEMMLAGGLSGRPMYDNGSIDLNQLSQEDIARMPPDELDALLAAHEEHGILSGMSNLDVGGSQLRQHHNRRPSRVGIGESPLFGSESNYSTAAHNGIGHTRVPSRAESSGLGSSSRYENRTRPVSGQFGGSPQNPRSLYDMPGQFDAYDRTRDTYRDRFEQGSMYDSLPGEYPEEGEFIITENHEHPGARIVERLGDVQADSRKASSASIAHRQDGLSERNEMHKAVKNLISEASQRGANGIVSLRVTDLPDGSCLASGEAVTLR